MSVVDEVIEAGARAFYEDPEGLTDWRKLVSVEPMVAQAYRDLMVRAARSAWPILSARLRELHLPEPYAQGLDYCEECEHLWPCVTVRELDRIDRELGIGEGEA